MNEAVASVNEVRLMGRIGEEPRFSADFRTLSFRMVTSERWTDRDGSPQERTEWHSVSIFGRGALALQGKVFLGCRVYVEGSLRTRRYQDRPITEINACRVLALGDRPVTADPACKGVF